MSVREVLRCFYSVDESTAGDLVALWCNSASRVIGGKSAYEDGVVCAAPLLPAPPVHHDVKLKIEELYHHKSVHSISAPG